MTLLGEEDNVDALIRAFASDNNDATVAVDEGGVVNGPDAADDNAERDGVASNASDSSGGVPEDALGDLSD